MVLAYVKVMSNVIIKVKRDGKVHEFRRVASAVMWSLKELHKAGYQIVSWDFE
jgi:hypothetical protein